MNEQPDSALAILESLGHQKPFNNDFENAHYALLLTQAKDKNYHFETDDSLISFAISFFEKTNDSPNLFLSLYYKALISFNNEDYSRSIIEALWAKDICENLDSAIFLARIHELLADIYNNSYNLDNAIHHREKSYTYYIKAGKKNNAIFSLIDLAREYNSYGNPTKSIAILDSIEKNCSTQDSILRGFLYDSYMRPYIKLENPQEALYKFRLAQRFLGINSSYLDYPSASIAFINNGQVDSAEYYLNLISSDPQYTNDENFHNAVYKLHKAKKNYTASISEFEKMFNIHITKVNHALKQSVAFKERDFYNTKSKIELLRAEKFVLITIILIILLIVVCISFFIKATRDKQKLDERMLEAHELSLQLQNHKDTLKKQYSLVYKLFQSHYATLDALSNEYFEKKDSEIMRKTIVKDFEKEIDKMRQPESINKLESIVNDCCNDIITRLKEQFPQFKEKDILFLTLIFAGFSPRSVCLFTDIKIGNYYNKKTRIRRKIESSNTPDKDFFLASIDNALILR